MSAKKANHAFLITVICYVGCAYVIALFFPELGENLLLGNLTCELVVTMPILLFALTSKEKLSDFLGFRKIKMSTIGMTALFTFLSMPTVTLFNLISQLWVENAVVSMMDSYQIGQMSFWQLSFSMVIIAPLFEEIACRGAYYHSYRKAGSSFGAMLLSAFIFALMHMNLNQAMYAFAIGLLLVMLVEASGSLWTSILYHALLNGSQSVMMYIMVKTYPTVFSNQAQAVSTDYLLCAIGVYLMLTAITLPAAWAVLVWISNNEGNNGALSMLWTHKKKDKTLTLSLVIALILSILAMSGILFEWINKLIVWLMAI